MIAPSGIDDESTATDDEIIAAYIDDGYAPEEAQIMLAAFRGRLPGIID